MMVGFCFSFLICLVTNYLCGKHKAVWFYGNIIMGNMFYHLSAGIVSEFSGTALNSGRCHLSLLIKDLRCPEDH